MPAREGPPIPAIITPTESGATSRPVTQDDVLQAARTVKVAVEKEEALQAEADRLYAQWSETQHRADEANTAAHEAMRSLDRVARAWDETQSP